MDAFTFREKLTKPARDSADKPVTVFTKIIQSTQRIMGKPPRVLNFSNVPLEAAANALDTIRDVPQAYASWDFIEQLKKIFNEQRYDLVLGIDYKQLEILSENELRELLSFISFHSLICVFRFPTFKNYYSNTHLKKIYKYLEIIPTAPAEIYVFCSNQYWYAKGNMSTFDKPPRETREWLGKADGCRRYYYNDNSILKYYEFYKEPGRIREVEKEIKFLTKNNFQDVFIPKIFDFHIGTYEGWILREKIPGGPLTDLIADNTWYDPVFILNEVLQQVRTYEQAQLFHSDLRPRNILLTTNGQILLIDYGALCVPRRKYSGYSGFIVLAYEIFHRQNSLANRRLIPEYLLESEFHGQYHRWLKLIFSIPHPQWTYSLFQRCLQEAKQSEALCAIDYEEFQCWLKKMNRLIAKRNMRDIRFEKMAFEKLAGYFSKKPIQHKLIEWAGKKLIMVYDTIYLAFKRC